MVYAYMRVSSKDQDLHKQKYGVLEYAQKAGHHIHEVIEESVSSRVSYKQRVLSQYVDRFQEGDILIVSELSRIGRSILEVMEILQILMRKNVEVHIVKGSMVLGSNIQSKVLAFAFSLAAEIERDLISSRTREALQKLKKDGVKLGRPVGSKSKSKLDTKEKDIAYLLAKKVSIRSICKIHDCSPSCLYNFIKSRKLK